MQTTNRRKLTNAFVRQVKTTGRRERYWDTMARGLCLQVEGSGYKSFMFMYSIRGRTRWYRIGPADAVSLAHARVKVGELWTQVLQGIDVQAQRRGDQKATTFAELAEAYWQAAEREHKSVAQYKGHWRRHLEKPLGHRPVETLETADFVAVKQRLEQAGKRGSIGPVIATASAILSWGINECMVRLASNPAHGVKMPKRDKKNNGRALGHDELRSLWPVLDEAGLAGSAMLKIMLFTGQRGDEVRHMRWQDIEGEWWTQATNKEDRVHRVWLSPTVRRVLADFDPADGPYVLGAQRPMVKLATPTLNRVRRTSGIADFRAHMLRHTVDTEMSRIDVAEEHRRKVLNHAEGGMTSTYGHYDFDREKHNALAKLEAHLHRVLAGEQADKVVRLHG